MKIRETFEILILTSLIVVVFPSISHAQCTTEDVDYDMSSNQNGNPITGCKLRVRADFNVESGEAAVVLAKKRIRIKTGYRSTPGSYLNFKVPTSFDVPQEKILDGIQPMSNPSKRSDLYNHAVNYLWSANACRRGNNDSWNTLNPECVNTLLHYYSSVFPSLIEVREIGKATDDSHKGNHSKCTRHGTCGTPILAAKIGSRVLPSSEKPTVLMVAGIHGFERAPMRILIDWMDYLVSNYIGPPENGFSQPAYFASYKVLENKRFKSTNISIRDMLDNYNIWIVPMVNNHSWYSNNPATKGTANGVNIDKNWAYSWGNDSGDTGPLVYEDNLNGAHPFSEAETRALLGFAESIGPSIFVNMHGHRVGFDIDDSPRTSDGKLDVVFDSTSSLPGGNHWSVTTNSNPLGLEAHRYVFRQDSGLSATPLPFFEYTFDDRIDWEDHLFDSLPYLSDQNARLFSCQDDWPNQWSGFTTHEKRSHCPLPVFWSPYSDQVATYSSDPDSASNQRGATAGTRQAHGYMWANMGAVSFLLEVPRIYWDEGSDPWDRTAMTFKEYRYGLEFGTVLEVFRSTETEDNLRKIVSDTFYALNRLVVASSNPIPAPHPTDPTGAFHDLAITGIFETVDVAGGVCDVSLTSFPAKGNKCCDNKCNFDGTNCPGPGLVDIQEKVESPFREPRTNSADPLNPSLPYFQEKLRQRGYFGSREVTCRVSNWGNERRNVPFKIHLAVENLDHPSKNDDVFCDVSAMAAGKMHHQVDVETCPLQFEFEQDDSYRISCELQTPSKDASDFGNYNALTESNAGAYLIHSNSYTCWMTDGAYPTCHGNKEVPRTNNYREKVFKAGLAQDAYCSN